MEVQSVITSTPTWCNQGTSAHSTYPMLFETSDGWATVSEIANKGIPMSKIVVGKPSYYRTGCG